MHTATMGTESENRPHTSAWYAAPITRFLNTPETQVLGELADASSFEITPPQRDAWVREIAILGTALAGLDGWVVLEFDIPRLGSRVDVVVVSGSALIPIEFKVGEKAYTRPDFNQAWDYALDLKNFHAASHHAPIFPILLATEAPDADSCNPSLYSPVPFHFPVRDDLEVFPQRCVTPRGVVARRTV